MDQLTPPQRPHRVGPVAPDLLGSAIFLYDEYLRQLAAEAEDGLDDDPPEPETRAVLDLFAEELGSDIATTLNLYMRLTALQRLLGSQPAIAALALDADEGDTLRENALVAAARLDLYVRRADGEGSADFDPNEFRDALEEEAE